MATPTYDLISSQVLSSSAASVTFSSIPATYRDLVLVFQGTASANGSDFFIQFNSDTGNNYSSVRMSGNGSATSSGTYSSIGYFIPTNEAGVAISNPSLMILNLMDYSATDKHKTVLWRNNTTTYGVTAMAGRWASTSAISSILIEMFGVQTFNSGSTFYLYGISA